MKAGDKAPDFEALDQHGNTVALRDLLAGWRPRFGVTVAWGAGSGGHVRPLV